MLQELNKQQMSATRALSPRLSELHSSTLFSLGCKTLSSNPNKHPSFWAEYKIGAWVLVQGNMEQLKVTWP